ncbi:MAG: phenylalanine--tRNA ligase subunit alpha [Actinomycetota bacterium]
MSAELRHELEAARAAGLQLIASASDMSSLNEAQIRTLGRKAPLSRARGELRNVSEDDRRELGRLANEIHSAFEDALAAKRAEFESADREHRWERDRVDVTLPGVQPAVGGLHPLTRTIWEIVDVFVGLGYRVAEGPEVELSTYNFDALNTPPEHPSRSPTDTYYVAGTNEGICLRPQTSPAQIRAMEAQEPPIYVVAPGRCYRRDEIDATHLNQFAQLECLTIDEGITMGDLKGTLETFARAIFGRDLDIRLRPSFFPFTEPSAEMDTQCFVCRGRDPGCRLCKGEGWIETLGAGMVDPTLLEWVGYDTERYTGFAFGMGIERVAALAHGVTDIRYFYDNDLRFLGYFRGLL